MNPFEQHCNEEIVIRHRDGRTTGPLKASFGNGIFTVFDATIDVSEQDIIDRPLPNGKAERYDIANVEFAQKFHTIPAHVEMKVRKQGALVHFEKPRVTNISIHNSHGIQVGDHNTQNFATALQQIIEHIDKSTGTPEEKAEAKSRLRKFLEHPLTTSIAGGAAGALAGLLK